MSNTFSGKAFMIHNDGGLSPEAVRQAVYTVTHIPGSDAQVLDYGGKSEGRLTVPCASSNYSDYSGWDALLGTFATLIYHGTTTNNVFLASIGSPQRYEKDPDVPVIFNLEFII